MVWKHSGNVELYEKQTFHLSPCVFAGPLSIGGALIVKYLDTR